MGDIAYVAPSWDDADTQSEVHGDCQVLCKCEH